MTTILSTLKTSGRAAIIALSLGAASFAALPAQAASEPSFNFQLGIGSDGNTFSFGVESPRYKNFRIKRCLTNDQVEEGLYDYGFDNVDVIRNLAGSRVLVEASYGSRDYRLKVNKCTGQVYDLVRIRRYEDDNSIGGGFGLQFNF